jgi:uncharacterized coiled-coil protein SlyX
MVFVSPNRAGFFYESFMKTVILSTNAINRSSLRELDPEGMPQFGLVAEEVEKVNPALIVRDGDGKPYTVRYEAVNAMLLNEFLKEHRTVQELKSTTAKQEAVITQLESTVVKQGATIAQQRKDLQATVAQQQKEIQALTASLKEQASQIQKVSAALEVSKPAPQTVLNNQ